MISRIKGSLIKKENQCLTVDVNGIGYDLSVPKTVITYLNQKDSVSQQGEIELVVYHYLSIDGNRAVPVMVGFVDELERDFFEKFISVAGIGPKVAIKAFDRPVAQIAKAIEENNLIFLQQLDGIGKQKAKQLVATLQGKVGRFALLQTEEIAAPVVENKEIIEEAKQILERLQYSSAQAAEMIKKVLSKNEVFSNVEEFLNEIYRQNRPR